MRIWQVTENDKQIRFYFFATKSEAKAHAREYEKDIPGLKAEIDWVDFAPNRAGLARALNWAMTLTCFNEA